jgi:hypothetical protein
MDLVNPQRLKADTCRHDIHDGIDGADFVEVDFVQVLAVHSGFGAGEIIEYGNGGFPGLCRYFAFVDDFGYLFEVTVLPLLGRYRVELDGAQAGTRGFRDSYVKAFYTERCELGLEKLSIKAGIEHGSDNHITGGARKTIKISNSHNISLITTVSSAAIIRENGESFKRLRYLPAVRLAGLPATLFAGLVRHAFWREGGFLWRTD